MRDYIIKIIKKEKKTLCVDNILNIVKYRTAYLDKLDTNFNKLLSHNKTFYDVSSNSKVSQWNNYKFDFDWVK